MGVGFTGAFWIYNITIIVCSLLLFLIGLYLNEYFKKLVKIGRIDQERKNTLSTIYIVSVIMIFFVGLIPYGHERNLSEIHLFAGDMVFVFIALTMLFSGFLFWGFRKFFHIFTYAILFVGLLFYYLYGISHYFTITFYEINSIILIALWVIFMVKYIELFELDGRHKGYNKNISGE
jgi:hypothetical membrane protein